MGQNDPLLINKIGWSGLQSLSLMSLWFWLYCAVIIADYKTDYGWLQKVTTDIKTEIRIQLITSHSKSIQNHKNILSQKGNLRTHHRNIHWSLNCACWNYVTWLKILMHDWSLYVDKYVKFAFLLGRTGQCELKEMKSEKVRSTEKIGKKISNQLSSSDMRLF